MRARTAGHAQVRLVVDDSEVDVLDVWRRPDESGEQRWGWDAERIDLSSRQLVSQSDAPELVAGVVRAWVLQHLPLTDPDVARLQAVRAKVEALVGALQLHVLENQQLHEELAESKAVIAQLEGTVKVLEGELRRARFNPKRVRFATKLVIQILATTVATGITTAAVEQHFNATPVAQSQTKSGETFRDLLHDFEELNSMCAALERQPFTPGPPEPKARPRRDASGGAAIPDPPRTYRDSGGGAAIAEPPS